MKKEVEFGIRVSVKESQAAAADLKDVGNAATKTAAQVDQTGRAMSSQLEAGAAAARNTSAATAGMAAAQTAAAERIQATAAASQQLGTATAQLTAAQAKAVEGLRVTNTQVKNVGISAAQTAAALRGIPAQFTDIFTSIAAGQSPMMVLMQQGGQLKDMFGGIGPAAKALGGHIAGLITPLTVAAAAAAVLAVSYNQGSREADNYAKALIMTGNAAGSTVGQMQAMAGRIDGIIGTQAAAAEALTQMAETGRVASRNLEQFTTVALKMERDVGQPVEATVKQFAELGKAPVEASLKLNEQYRYLTATVYEQIRALQDQGRATDAAALAQTTFADAMAARASQIEGNLGMIERGWRAIKSTAKEAWDAMLNVGRQSSLESQLKSAADNVAALEAKLEERQRSGRAVGDIAPKLAAAKAWVATLQENLKLDNQSAAAAAERARAEEAGINFSKVLYEGRTKQQKLEADIVKVRADGLAAGKTEHEIQKAIGVLREKYADKSRTPGAEAVGNRELADLKAQIAVQDQLTASLEQYGLQADKVGAGDRKIAAIQQQLTLVQKDRIGKVNDAALQEQLIEATRLAAAEKRNAELKKSLQIQADVTAEVTKWANATQISQSLLDEEIALFGMSAEARKIASAQIKVDADLRSFLAQQQQKGNKLLPDEIALLMMEAEARKQNIAAIEGQRQALAGAEQLRQENLRFAADAIADERERAAALLEIDAQMWRDRIRLAGDGTEEQKKLQEQFDQWYINRQNKPMIDASRQAVDQINNDFREGFRNMVNGGRDTWSSFTRSLATTFKTTVADAIYKTFAQKFVVNIAANVLGMFGLGGVSAATQAAGVAGSGGLGILNSASSLFTVGKTIWNGFSSGIGSALGGLVSSFGNTIGSSMVSAFGNGMAMTTAQAAAATGAGAVNAGVGVAGSAGTAINAGAAFAKAVPVIGWIIAGMMKNASWFDQGWDPSNGTMSNAGKLIGSPTLIPDKLLRSLGVSSRTASILTGSALFSRAFGRKNPEVESFGVQGDFSATGFTGNQYKNILEKGGWFRSDKRYQQTQALDEELADTLNSGIQGLVAATKGFGGVLGIEAATIDGYTKSISLNLDRDASKSQEIVSSLFTDIADELSARLVPSIADFAKSGESAASTLQRLADEYTAVNDVLWSIGKTSEAAFGAVSLASMEMRNRLIEAAGGIEALSQGVAFYAANFLTKAEQLAPTMEMVADTLNRLGATGVDVTAENARQQFRDFAESLDLTTQAGADAYATVIRIAPAFVTVSDFWVESAQQAQAAISQAQETARRTEEERARAIDTARSVLTEAYNREADALKSRIDRFAGAAKSLRTFLDSLQVGNLSTLSPAGKYFELKERFNRTYDLARSGDENAIGQLQDVSQQFLEASREYNASSQGYVEDFDRVRAALEATARTAMSQAGIAQEQLTQLQSSVQGLLDINQSVISVHQAIVELGAALTAGGQHVSAGAQSSVIESMYQSILGRSSDAAGKTYWENSLASGVPVEAIRTEFLNSQEYRGNQVEQLYQDILGRASETAGKEFWVNALNNGVSYESIRDQFLTSPEYLSLHGSHANGLRYVPFDGYRAELHRGERVLTEAEARRADASGGQTSVESRKQTDAIERQNGLLTELITVVQDGQDVSWKDMRKLRKQMVRTLSQAVPA